VGVSADAGAQHSRELWRRNTNAEITLHEVLPSGDFLVSTNAMTMLLSPDTGDVKWQRDDVVSCETRRDRGPTPTCRVGGQREFMSSFGPYLRFETDLPEGTPSNYLNQTCHGDRSCIESAILRGAPKKGIGMSFKPTHDHRRLLLVDAATGRDAFDSRVAGLDDVDGTCLLPRENTLMAWSERDGRQAIAAAFELAAARTLWTRELPLSKDIQCLPLDGSGLVLTQGRGAKDKMRVFGIDASTGVSRWENTELAEKEWKLPVGLSGTGSNAGVHVNASGPMQIDLQKGTVIWRVDPFAGGDPVGDVNGRIPRPQPIVEGADLYYLTWKDKLVAVNRTGAIAWIRSFPESPVVVAETPLGLLTRAHLAHQHVRLELLYPQNGQTRWSAVVNSISGWLLTNDALFHVTSGKMHRLSLTTGEAQALGDATFATADPPVDLSFLEDAIVVTSSEHLAAFEQKGGSRYEHHVPAPGMSRTEKLLASALAGARTTASYMEARSRAKEVAK